MFTHLSSELKVNLLKKNIGALSSINWNIPCYEKYLVMVTLLKWHVV
jgi:hypothetical protein